MSVGIGTRDLRLFLDAATAAVANPETAAKLLALAERAEVATQRFLEEQSELACQRAEHARELAQASEAQAERLRRERDAWDREVAERRRRLEIDEDEAARRREAADKDRQAAAALRCRLEQKFAPAHKALGEFQQQ